MAGWSNILSKAAKSAKGAIAAPNAKQIASLQQELAPEAKPIPLDPEPSAKPKAKKFKQKKKPDADSGYFNSHLLKVLAKAEKEGDLILTENGWVDANLVDPDLDSHPAMSDSELNAKLQELSDYYGVLGEHPSDAPIQHPADAAIPDPWADIGPTDIEPPAPKGWDKVEAATMPLEGKRYVQPLPASLRRGPGENIRDYIQRIKQFDTKYQATAMEGIEQQLARNVREGRVGPLISADGPSADIHNRAAQDYLDYLAANNVDQRTIDAVASGELSMDPFDRMDRAVEMGLDPNTIWYRWDYPLKTEMKGWTGAALTSKDFRRQKHGKMPFVDLEPSREGLVYTSHNPEYALHGVQIPENNVVLYPLIGPNDGIAGLDPMPSGAYDKFNSVQDSLLRKAMPDDGSTDAVSMSNAATRRRTAKNQNLAEYIGPSTTEGRGGALRVLDRIMPGFDTGSYKRNNSVPSFSQAESRKTYTEPLMASGATGTLVSDETGLSTAFTPAGAQRLRRVDLAPLDPRFARSRNILQGLLAPVAVGAAASQGGDK